MRKFQLYPAQIIANNDEDKKGRVQFKIEHLMDEVKPADLPWAYPFRLSFGGADDSGISAVPEVESKVWIFYMDDTNYREAYYMADMRADDSSGKCIHNVYEDSVKSEVGAQAVYPDVKYISFPNGITLGVSTNGSLPEITIYHPSMYIFIDQNGYFYYKDEYENRIRIDNTGIRIKDMSNNEIASTSTSWVINNNLEVLQ